MNQETQCTAVMYHYVRDPEKTRFPRIKSLRVDEFMYQLDYLQKHFTIISYSDYLAYLAGNKQLPEKVALLSFDDGFKDHYSTVFPILKKRGLSGIFYPCTGPLTDGKMLLIHKSQFLLAHLGTDKYWEEFNRVGKAVFPDRADVLVPTEVAVGDKGYRWDDPRTVHLKTHIARLANDLKEPILTRIFSEHIGNEAEFCKELYITWEEMREMKQHGMEFGTHTHTHVPLAHAPAAVAEEELVKSKQIMEQELGCPITAHCYPHGAYNDDVVALLKKTGYESATTIVAEVAKGRVSPLLIPRLDTKDLPHNDTHN